MTNFFTKKSMLIIAVITIFSITSCQKEINENIDNNNDTSVVDPSLPPDLTTRINSSVSGFVTNENDAAVNGAVVRFGNTSTTTDKYGYFEFNDINVIKATAVVTVEKSGYFNGIKTYQAETGKASFFRIKLIPKTTSGSINALSGGNVTLSNGLSVFLPSTAVVYAATNAPYSGTINVAAFWINPTANDLTEIMPGDLRGIDKNGLLKGLTTYGMCAIELTSPAGELLQIAPNKKATLTFPLPSALMATAPTTIPLWYFDENKGLWIEDGTATKVGSTYVGDVSHFSFWNCDLPNAIVPLTFNVIDSAGNPVANAHVEIRPLTPSSWSHIGGYTDATGHVAVFVTPNTLYSLEIYGSTCYYWNSTQQGYSQQFTATTTPINLGNIVITGPATANVSGTVTDCNGLPVTNGYLVMQNGYYNYRYTLDNLGQYNFSTMLCSGSTSVSFIAEDATSAQQSTPLPYTINSGNNSIQNLQACGISINQYINYSVDGTTYSMTAPADSFLMYVNPQVAPSTISIYNMGRTSGSGSVNYTFTSNGIGVGSTQVLNNFYTSQIQDTTTINSPINVNITEYGAIGQFIAGNFAGTLTGSAPGLIQYTITCNFRIRRSQ